MSSQIQLFDGLGTYPVLVDAFEHRLNDIADDRQYCIKRIHSFEEGGPQGDIKVSALIIPGGNVAEMMSRGVEGIAEDVHRIVIQNNVPCFGSCAGALLLCSGIHESLSPKYRNSFHANPDAGLGVYPGNAVVPYYGFHQREITACDLNLLDVKIKATGKSLHIAHIRGPGFFRASTVPSTEILADYVDPPAEAFTFLKFGNCAHLSIFEASEISESLFYSNGQAKLLLTGSHPEVDSTTILSEQLKSDFSLSTMQQSGVASMMRGEDQARNDLLKTYFEKIGLQCK